MSPKLKTPICTKLSLDGLARCTECLVLWCVGASSGTVEGLLVTMDLGLEGTTDDRPLRSARRACGDDGVWRRRGEERGQPRGKQGHLRSFYVSVDPPSTTSWRGRVQHRSCWGALALPCKDGGYLWISGPEGVSIIFERGYWRENCKILLWTPVWKLQPRVPWYHGLVDIAWFDLSLAYGQVHLKIQAFFPFVRKSKEQGPISCANTSRKSCLPTTAQIDLGLPRKTSWHIFFVRLKI